MAQTQAPAPSAAPTNGDQPLAQWLREAPFALAMSSGFFGFFAHTGVLTALLEAGYAPSAVHGSSAGALVGGLWAAGLPPDRLAQTLMQLRRVDFWDPKPGLGLLRGQRFDSLLRQLVPGARLESAVVPTHVSVFDVGRRTTETLTQGDLVTALRASCAVPVLFQPVWVGGRPKLDGGIADRPGLAGVEPRTRVLYHHLLPNSPWRQRDGVHSLAPMAVNMRNLVIRGLPKVTPFALAAGKDAFELALKATRAALRQSS